MIHYFCDKHFTGDEVELKLNWKVGLETRTFLIWVNIVGINPLPGKTHFLQKHFLYTYNQPRGSENYDATNLLMVPKQITSETSGSIF